MSKPSQAAHDAPRATPSRARGTLPFTLLSFDAALAQALHVGETEAQSSWEQITAHLTNRGFLLVLDNFEHVLPAATRAAELLATSSAPERARHEPRAADRRRRTSGCHGCVFYL